MITEEKHKEDVAKLETMENKLINLIAESDNEDLQDLFLDWQEQRGKCNNGYSELMTMWFMESKSKARETNN